MAESLLGQLSGMVTPQMLDQVSKVTGVDTSLLTQGMNAVGATTLGSMANSTKSADGLSSLMSMVTKTSEAAAGGQSTDMGGMLSSLLGGGGGGASASSITDSVMGSGINAISGTLSKTLGFNVAPMLSMAAPALLGVVAKAVKSGGLDANGVKDMLNSQVEEFTKDPANAETVKLAQSALDAGKQGTAIRDKYTDEGWKAITNAPLLAVSMVAAASPSKGRGAASELGAAVSSVAEASGKADPVSLMSVAFAGGVTPEAIQTVMQSMGTANPVDAIKAGVDQVAQGNPKEVAAYKAMILNTAQATAAAGKEGGFLGIGGQQISAEEQAVLDQLKAALA